MQEKELLSYFPNLEAVRLDNPLRFCYNTGTKGNLPVSGMALRCDYKK